MHVVNSLEDGRAVLRELARARAAGRTSPLGEVGKRSVRRSAAKTDARFPGEGDYELAPPRPHPDLQPIAEGAIGQIRPLPQGEVRLAAPLVLPIELCTHPFAACHAGVNYYWHLVCALRTEFPDVDFSFTLCCGDDAAIAHDALRMGFTLVRCECGDGQFTQLQAAAAAVGAVVTRGLPISSFDHNARDIKREDV